MWATHENVLFVFACTRKHNIKVIEKEGKNTHNTPKTLRISFMDLLIFFGGLFECDLSFACAYTREKTPIFGFLLS